MKGEITCKSHAIHGYLSVSSPVSLKCLMAFGSAAILFWENRRFDSNKF